MKLIALFFLIFSAHAQGVDYDRIRLPQYPYTAIHNNEQGTVKVRVLVTPDGRVGNANVHLSSGYSLLDSTALWAVRHWTFTLDQQDVTPQWVIVPVRFELRD